jgi:two-component system, NarL family, nitrate/nitrite response regulator NarL
VSLTCLIVDDSDDFLASATRLFLRQGLEVVGVASSGAEALRLAQTLQPDIALVDVELGDEDGIEVGRRMTSAPSGTQVIFISIRNRDQLTELMAGSGAVGFLRKDELDAGAIADLVEQGQRRPDAEPPHVS